MVDHRSALLECLYNGVLIWLKQNKPPMTGNGNPTTYKNGDDWGMVYS